MERHEAPPQAPPGRPRLRFLPIQRIGIPLLLLAPVLALAGVLGPHQARAETQAGPLAVRVEFPSRLREHQPGRVIVDVENRGGEPLAVEVALAPEYVERFVESAMTPPPIRAWAAELPPIAPRARSRATLEFLADAPGWHRGTLRVSGAGHRATVEITTLVLP